MVEVQQLWSARHAAGMTDSEKLGWLLLGVLVLLFAAAVILGQ